MALSVFSFSLLLQFSLLSCLCFARVATDFNELRDSDLPVSPPSVPQQIPITSTAKKSISKLVLSILGNIIAAILLLVVGRLMKCLRKYRLRGPHCYQHQDLINATHGFSTLIKSSNNENIYWGTLHDGTQIAIKFLAPSVVTNKNFARTVRLLSKLQHKHLVQFLGYSKMGGDQMLVYEFMQHRSLREALDNAGQPSMRHRLNWCRRLQIAADVAEGIQYIHTSCAPKKSHGDLKSSNILLDKNMRAKVSSLFQIIDHQENSAQRDDIVNIGIVLLELIVGQRAGIGDARRDAVIAWVALHAQQPEQPEQLEQLETGVRDMMDPYLIHQNMESVHKIAQLAMECVNRQSVNSPTISTVLIKIRHALFMEQTYI